MSANSPKQIAKIIVDVLMSVGLLLLMPYSILGEAAHEWVGTAMFALFITHHILNGKWHAGVFKGKHTAFRVLQTALAVLVLVSMLGSMASGAVLSGYAFKWVIICGLSAIERTAHMLCAYWGFVLMSLHLGLHWNVMLGMARKLTKKPSSARKWLLRGIAVLISGYGVYAFIKRGLAGYMFLKNHFAFFDFEEPIMLFLLDYLAVMALFVCAGHYISALIVKIGKRVPLGQTDCCSPGKIKSRQRLSGTAVILFVHFRRLSVTILNFCIATRLSEGIVCCETLTKKFFEKNNLSAAKSDPSVFHGSAKGKTRLAMS